MAYAIGRLRAPRGPRLDRGTRLKGRGGDADLGDMTQPTSPYRQFSVARDELGTIRIVNDATKHIMAALSQREAKQLSKELRRAVKATSKS